MRLGCAPTPQNYLVWLIKSREKWTECRFKWLFISLSYSRIVQILKLGCAPTPQNYLVWLIKLSSIQHKDSYLNAMFLKLKVILGKYCSTILIIITLDIQILFNMIFQ
jgi:hypothetical protein